MMARIVCAARGSSKKGRRANIIVPPPLQIAPQLLFACCRRTGHNIISLFTWMRLTYFLKNCAKSATE
jgi:hypothetical protein